MKILFDARVLGEGMHGIARYCQGLLSRLLAEDREHEYLVLIAREEVKTRFRYAAPVRWIVTSIPLYGIGEQTLLPLRTAGLDFDLYHSPTFTIPLAFARKGVITIHDLIPILFPRDYGLGHRLFFHFVVGKALARVRKVVTVSRRSAMDILDRYRIPVEKVVITPNGLDPRWGPEAASPLETKIEGRYILFVGNPKPHKNFRRLLAAFEILCREEGYEGRLAAVGIPPGELPPALQGRVLFLSHCNDRELNALYSHADLLAAPSLYEGFGLPVLEAMACGCPVLIGDRGALPEVAGEAAFQVNPLDIRAIKEGMFTVITNAELRSTLQRRGRERAATFTWERTARAIRDAYRELEKNP